MDCQNDSFNFTNVTHRHFYTGPELCNYKDLCFIPQWNVWGIQVVIGILTLTANAFSASILIRLTSLNQALRISLINLSLTDVIGSASYIYHITRGSLDLFTVNIECKIRYLLYVTMNVVTLITLQYLSVERFLSIAVPFLHNKFDSKNVTIFFLVVNWVVTLCVMVSGMHELNSHIPVCIYHIMVPRNTHLINFILAMVAILIIISINVFMYMHARKQIYKISQTLVGVEREERIFSMEIKATKTTIAVVVPFVLLNSPLYSLMLYFYIHPDFMMACESVYLLNGFSTLLLVNSLTNPAIYAWKLASVREEFWKIMPCHKKRTNLNTTAIEM